jgi:hypothetical protein
MTGAKGNIEYLLLLGKTDTGINYQPVIETVVKESHLKLD